MPNGEGYYIYTSSIIGDIPESLYDILDDVSYSELLEWYATVKGRRAQVIPAILRTERSFSGVRTGQDIYDYLIKYGFSEGVAISAVRLFAAHDEVISVLVEMEYDEESVAYDYTYLRKLKEAGFEAISIRPSYALESNINVRPIKVEFVAPPPPPEVLYRSQATFTYTKGKKRVEMRIWYQSYSSITEQTLIDKWNDEAMENANNLPNSNLGGLLDELQEDPGFEANMEIERDEVVGELDKWYGKLVFTDKKTAQTYTYDIL